MFNISTELLQSVKEAIMPQMQLAGVSNARVYGITCGTCQNTCKGTCRNKCDQVGKGTRR